MSSAEITKHFLVIYDIKLGRAEVRELGTDYDAAQLAYAEAEREARDRTDLDVVLLSADSLETIKRTHSSYFPWPTSTRHGLRPELQAESMSELRTFSREGRAHELGELLLALALHGSLSRQDMAIATELPEREVERIIAEFRDHDLECKARAAADIRARHSLA
jgi:hypothetical protein